MFIVHLCIVLLILQFHMPPFVRFCSEHVKGNRFEIPSNFRVMTLPCTSSVLGI